MLFLVDYENVGNMGMKGCRYLNEADHVVVFYSDARRHMERRFLEDIANSGCIFEICKLYKCGKNALDFYITSKLGALSGSGITETAVIVSRDNGFQAVCDYWEKRAIPQRTVLLSSCVEDGIVSGENNDRAKKLRRLRENLTIGGYFADYTETMRVKGVIKNLFDGTEYEEMTGEIQKLMEEKKKTPKVIYLNCLHSFGRDNGLAIYNRMKACGEL